MQTDGATQVHINSRVGDSVTRRVPVKLNGESEQDLTGNTFRVATDTDTPVSATIDDSGVASGYFDFEFTIAQTTALGEGSFPMGIKVETAAGKEYTIGEGYLTLRVELVD